MEYMEFKCTACDRSFIDGSAYLLDDGSKICRECYGEIHRSLDPSPVFVPPEKIARTFRHGSCDCRFWIRLSDAGKYLLCPDCHQPVKVEFRGTDPVISIRTAVWIIASFVIIQMVLIVIGFLIAISSSSPPPRF